MAMSKTEQAIKQLEHEISRLKSGIESAHSMIAEKHMQIATLLGAKRLADETDKSIFEEECCK